MTALDIALTESRTLRAQHVAKTDVLDKVKALTLLPDGIHATTEIVASYFEVTPDAIKKVVQRNREEMSSNGYLVAKGARLRGIKDAFPVGSNHAKSRSLALFTLRTVLNVAMLLTQSDIARQVRWWLIQTVEPNATGSCPEPRKALSSVYVVGYSSGNVKVGIAESPLRRIAQHRLLAGMHGVSLTDTWCSDSLPRQKARAAERTLIERCTEIYGPPTGGREQFGGANFADVRAEAATLASKCDTRPAVLL